MFEDYPDLMTAKQAAKALKISLGKVYELIHSRKIDALWVTESDIRVPKMYLQQFVLKSCEAWREGNK